METINGNGTSPFPKILRQLRKNRDWSQGQLAQKIGIDTQRISKYERGASTPPLETLVKISKTLEVSLDYLLTGKRYGSQKLKNSHLIERIEDIETLPVEYQNTLISVLDSFIKCHKFEELAQH